MYGHDRQMNEFPYHLTYDKQIQVQKIVMLPPFLLTQGNGNQNLDSGISSELI